MPNNDHGKEDNITNETFRRAAAAMDMDYADTLTNARELIAIELTEHDGGAREVHGHGLAHQHDHDHSEDES